MLCSATNIYGEIFLLRFGTLFADLSEFDNVAFQMREHTDLSEEPGYVLKMLSGQPDMRSRKPSLGKS